MNNPSLQLVEISLLERSGSAEAGGLFHTVLLHNTGGNISVRVQVVDSSGNPSSISVLSYMNMSSGSIGPRGVA